MLIAVKDGLVGVREDDELGNRKGDLYARRESEGTQLAGRRDAWTWYDVQDELSSSRLRQEKSRQVRFVDIELVYLCLDRDCDRLHVLCLTVAMVVLLGKVNARPEDPSLGTATV